MGMTMRTTTSGGRAHSSICPPPHCHCSTPQLPEVKKKKDIERAYKKMTAKEKNDLMQKLAELEAEDANDNESVPPSPTPV